MVAGCSFRGCSPFGCSPVCLHAESVRAVAKHIASNPENVLGTVWFFMSFLRDAADDLVQPRTKCARLISWFLDDANRAKANLSHALSDCNKAGFALVRDPTAGIAAAASGPTWFPDPGACTSPVSKLSIAGISAVGNRRRNPGPRSGRLVPHFINTTTFAMRGFWPRRGASDLHTLQGSYL